MPPYFCGGTLPSVIARLTVRASTLMMLAHSGAVTELSPCASASFSDVTGELRCVALRVVVAFCPLLPLMQSTIAHAKCKPDQRSHLLAHVVKNIPPIGPTW